MPSVQSDPGLRERGRVLTAIALALSGFAGLGMEILWFRHFSIMLGAFRAVFSLLLTVILVGIGAGSLRRRRRCSAAAGSPAHSGCSSRSSRCSSCSRWRACGRADSSDDRPRRCPMRIQRVRRAAVA